MITEDPVTIGRYKVQHRLGAGAMGVVYLCQDPLLKRKVAVKVVQKTRSDSDLMKARFQRESEISAQLNHPNIITVFDVGSDELAGPFLTMEFVDGCSLASLLGEGPMDPEQALDLLAQLGRALVSAERAGVVHRDVKPENMLVSRDGVLKLTDFGLARDDESRLTTTGVVMGTPSYTAPELLTGATATAATDRWAFSVTAFQLLTGRYPHPGDSLPAVLHHIANEQPVIPEGMPAPLARVFLKALHRDASRRYDSILAFMTALAEALGLRQVLSTKGLVQDAAPAPAEADSTATVSFGAQQAGETRAVPAAGTPSPVASPVPGAAKASSDRAFPLPGTQASGTRLTGPPSDLLKGGADAGDVPEERGSGGPPPLAGGKGPVYRAAPRAAFPAPVRPKPSYGWVAPTLLALGFGGAYLFWPRSLEVRSTPPAARVVVDGRPVGATPYKGSLSRGKHTLEVQLDGYDSVVQAVDAGGDPVEVALQPTTSWVDLVSEPAGATATLGGRTLGPTPRTGVPVPDRPQALVLTLKGYKRWEGTLGPGVRPAFPVKLERDGK